MERAGRRSRSLFKKREEFTHKCEVRSKSRAEREQLRAESEAPEGRTSARPRAVRSNKTSVLQAATYMKELDLTPSETASLCGGHRLACNDPWQAFIDDDASFQNCLRWMEHEKNRPSMDDSTDEGSVCAGDTPSSSTWGSPALPVLPGHDDMEALEMPVAQIDVQVSPPMSPPEAQAQEVQDVHTAPEEQQVQEEDSELEAWTQADLASTEDSRADQATQSALGTDATERDDEWVMVPPPSADSLRPGALDMVDGQHPRNLFAKKPHTKQTAQLQGAQDRAWAIDWSQEGMPHEVKSHLIKAKMDAFSRGILAKETMPLDILREQNVASRQRQSSASRSRENSTTRSHSKPRVIKQPNGRR